MRSCDARTNVALLCLTALCLVLCLLAGGPDAAAGTPQTVFSQANALYSQGQYAEAARAYEQILAAGHRSGNLYFNLGNAYFKNGRLGSSILNYERARRIVPGDTDVEANLAHARSVAGVDGCPPRLWHTLAFPLTHRLSTNGLVWTASAAYSLALVACAGYLLWPRRPCWLAAAAVLAGGLFVVAGVSLARQIFLNDWQRPAVVLTDGKTPARFAPAETGTEHFVLTQGALVRLLVSRPGWHQIARCDGKRGWVAEHHLERLWK